MDIWHLLLAGGNALTGGVAIWQAFRKERRTDKDAEAKLAARVRKDAIAEWEEFTNGLKAEMSDMRAELKAAHGRERNLLVEAAEQRAEIRHLKAEIAELKVAVEECRKSHE